MSAKRAARRRAAKIRAKAAHHAPPPLSGDSESWDTAVVAKLSAALRVQKDLEAEEQRWQALTSEEQAELAALEAASDSDWDAYAQRMEDFGLAPRFGPESQLIRLTATSMKSCETG